MKLKMMLSAVLLAGVISAQAESSSSTSAMTSGASSTTSTNGGSVDAMTTLFGDPVVAKSKNFQIKRSEVDAMASSARANFESNGRQAPSYLDAMVLNHLIIVQLMLQKATDADRAAGKAESELQFSNLLASASSAENFQRELKLQGTTEEQIRNRFTQEATAEAAVKRELAVTIPQADIVTCYSNFQAKFEEPERVHCEHIMLLTVDPTTGTPLSTNTVAAKLKQAQDLLKRVKAGEDFATLARQYSEDPGSKLNGGDLPPFPRGVGAMPAEIEAAAFSLAPGQVSDVVTSKYGFHIIKLLDKTPAKQYGLNDPIPEADNKTPAQVCHDQLEAEKISTLMPPYIEKLKTDSGLQIVDPDLKAQTDQMMQDSTNAVPGNT